MVQTSLLLRRLLEVLIDLLALGGLETRAAEASNRVLSCYTMICRLEPSRDILLKDMKLFFDPLYGDTVDLL